MAVLDHGYHGNTSTMIDLSPYKFNGEGGTGQPDWVTVFPLADPYRTTIDNAAYEAEVNQLLATGPPVAGFLGGLYLLRDPRPRRRLYRR